MHKGKTIIGKSLVAFDTGKMVNHVTDIAYNPNTGKIVGLLVDETLQLAKGRHVPLSEVLSYGEDAITITSENSIQTWDEQPLIKEFIHNKLNLEGRSVMTEYGENLGKISDIYFLDDGTIEGYEVSSGLVSDTYSGTSFLPNSRIAKIGEDVVFVPQNTEQLFDSQVGGLKATTKNASEKAKSTFETTKETVGEKARFGMEYMDTHVMEPTSKTKEQLHEAFPSKAQDIKNSAESVWDKLKDKVIDIKDQGSQQLEEKRVKGALGRPVTRVIFDQNDEIILNTGDLITHQAIAQAREAGMLDVLLNSVYTDKPDFSNEELKANNDSTDS